MLMLLLDHPLLLVCVLTALLVITGSERGAILPLDMFNEDYHYWPFPLFGLMSFILSLFVLLLISVVCFIILFLCLF